MVGAIGVIGWHTYSSWKAGPWDFPMPTKTLPIAVAGEKSPAPAKVAFNTDNIISKNLFDPERGAGATREAEENSRSSQRVRNVILIGTVRRREFGRWATGPAAAATADAVKARR